MEASAPSSFRGGGLISTRREPPFTAQRQRGGTARWSSAVNTRWTLGASETRTVRSVRVSGIFLTPAQLAGHPGLCVTRVLGRRGAQPEESGPPAVCTHTYGGKALLHVLAPTRGLPAGIHLLAPTQ